MGTLFVDKLDPQSGTSLEIGSSGDTITIPSGCTITNNGTQTGFGGDNKPAFQAHGNATQSVSSDSLTKLQFNTESFDLGSCYDHSTNYRFTPNVAGKYFVYLQGQWGSASDWNSNRFEIHKNGSDVASTQGRNEFYDTMYVATVLDMNGSSDYVEAYGRQSSGSNQNAALDDSARMRFGAYKLIS